jgi:hypothetical protein
MTSSLFQHARHHGVVIPGFGETVELPDDAAASLIAAKHAEAVEDEAEAPEVEPVVVEPREHDPMSTADVAAVETAEAVVPEVAAEPERRAPGRPRKRAE